MEEVEYRGYVFVNRALSSIQKGVQGAHALVELTKTYNTESNDAASTLHEWRESHKTLVFVDCGFHQEMLEHYLTAVAYCEKLELPHALFIEDDWTMNSMATAFAIIVPSTIYDIDIAEFDMGKKYYLSGAVVGDDPDDVALCRFLKSFRLAV